MNESAILQTCHTIARRKSPIALACAVLLQLSALLQGQSASAPATTALEPIRYTFRVADPVKHLAEIEARVPASGRTTLDLMMPVWTPGYYVVEDYASRVQGLTAKGLDGAALAITRPTPNRWQVETRGSSVVVLSYTLTAQGRSVTSNWVDADLGVINGGAAFITLAERARRPHEVKIEMPPTWKQSASGLEPAPGGHANHYHAADFDTLADSPIVAGDLEVREFVVDGTTHVVVDAGQRSQWDSTASARELERIVKEVRKFWGFLPFKRYVFLNVFRQGGGGLEHANSTLLTSSPKSTAPTERWLAFVAHEYVHGFNVKRLRPIELGPFDYETPPRTTSLWLSEGGTTYLANLMLVRAGITTPDQFLASMSSAIADLQKSPGRLLQSLEQSSAEVWTNSNSGVGARASTVSYYGKGNVVSFLLDAHVRRATNGRKSLDDVMRLAYARYGGERGFTADELRATVEQVAGKGMKALVRQEHRFPWRAGLRRVAGMVRAALRRRRGSELECRSAAARHERAEAPLQSARHIKRTACGA
jgi:predicted metalloprotease with PDZ domain